MRTPKNKLKALADSYKLSVNSIEIFSKNKDGVGAEDSIPIFISIYTRAELTRFVSTLK